jgi:hypothetical protein
VIEPDALCLPRIVSVVLNTHPCGTLIADLIDELATLVTVALGGLAVSASPRRVPPSAGNPFCKEPSFASARVGRGDQGEAEFPLRMANVDATGLFRLSGASLVSVV